MPRHRVLVAWLGGLALLASGCSSSSTHSPSATAGGVAPTPSAVASQAASTTASPATAGSPVTIQEWSWYHNDPGKALFQNVADEYHAAHPNVTIRITLFQPDDLTTKVAAALQAGSPPDMWVSLGGGRLASFAWITFS